MLIYLWAVVIGLAIWLYFRQRLTKFEKFGVKHTPVSTNLANLLRVLARREHAADVLKNTYLNNREQRFLGSYEFFTPMVLVFDPEVIKRITVKDFEHFVDHRSFINKDIDPMLGRMIIVLTGQEWRDMRATLSPAFTSSKIRLMVPFMVNVGEQMIESLKQKIKQSNNDYIDIDGKDLSARYGNDVIASCAFGLNVNSHTDVDNLFYSMGKKAVSNNGISMVFKFFFVLALPKLAAKLKLSVFPEEIKSFFMSMVTDSIKDREARNIVRPDMIHLLMEAKKGKLVHENKAADADAGFATVEESAVGKVKIDTVWTDNDIVAQAIIFFFAGFETVTSTMAFALHELALNPDVQEKLAQEIKETDARTGGKFDYTTIQNMTYMDMVVSEVLRLWPPGIQLDRLCIKDYNLGKANDDPAAKDYHIEAGQGIFIPVYGIHRNPEYFPDPLKFDPERFSEENKHKIQPFTYLPFGSGPRNCIGSRFALCEVKVMLYQLLQQMMVLPNEKTCSPSELDTKTFAFILKGGHNIRLKIRS